MSATSTLAHQGSVASGRSASSVNGRSGGGPSGHHHTVASSAAAQVSQSRASVLTTEPVTPPSNGSPTTNGNTSGNSDQFLLGIGSHFDVIHPADRAART